MCFSLVNLLILVSLWCPFALLDTSNRTQISDEPLFLTPFIHSGGIEEARKKSAVLAFHGNIVSHSGYLTVNEKTNSHLFFWFFQSTRRDWKSSPLLLWLQGGPGWSSMFGLFVENGPYVITKEGIEKRKFPWTGKYNVIYIDSPIGTGYSYTENYYVTTQEEIGQHLHIALVQFFKLFPELQKTDFFITGESYAGKYIPSLAYTIHKRNSFAEEKINLKGLFIGNAYSDPENMHNYACYLHRLGLIDYKTRLDIESMNNDERILIRSKSWPEAWLGRKAIFSALLNNTAFRYLYDYTRENYNGDDLYVKLLQNDDTKRKLHVGRNNFTFFSQSVYNNLKNEISTSVKPWIEELLENYRIVFYSGQLDIIVSHQMTSEFIQGLHWSGAELFSVAERRKWYWNDHLVGYYKDAGNLTEVFVRGSGHLVPASKPQIMLDLLEKFVHNKF